MPPSICLRRRSSDQNKTPTNFRSVNNSTAHSTQPRTPPPLGGQLCCAGRRTRTRNRVDFLAWRYQLVSFEESIFRLRLFRPPSPLSTAFSGFSEHSFALTRSRTTGSSLRTRLRILLELVRLGNITVISVDVRAQHATLLRTSQHHSTIATVHDRTQPDAHSFRQRWYTTSFDRVIYPMLHKFPRLEAVEGSTQPTFTQACRLFQEPR